LKKLQKRKGEIPADPFVLRAKKKKGTQGFWAGYIFAPWCVFFSSLPNWWWPLVVSFL
jgi:hypothetical protein